MTMWLVLWFDLKKVELCYCNATFLNLNKPIQSSLTGCDQHSTRSTRRFCLKITMRNIVSKMSLIVLRSICYNMTIKWNQAEHMEMKHYPSLGRKFRIRLLQVLDTWQLDQQLRTISLCKLKAYIYTSLQSQIMKQALKRIKISLNHSVKFSTISAWNAQEERVEKCVRSSMSKEKQVH